MSTASETFRSSLGPVIERYLALRRALGRDCDSERRIFMHLDRFLASLVGSAPDLTADVFAQWCLTYAHLRSGVRRGRMRIVRNLCLYRRRTEPTCFVPDPTQFPAEHQRVRPHIFTEAEIASLLRAALALRPSPCSPLRPRIFHLAIVLLYTCGLRRRELVRLTLGDYDPQERMLLVRASKFHKSRMIPLSSDATAAVEVYLDARKALSISMAPASPLLWHLMHRRQSYSGGGLGLGLRALLRLAGIYTVAGEPPRVHDFRHTFAVHALLRWYQAGADVQAKLPHLAAYMGHVSFASTEYYLHFVQPLADQASERFARHCTSLLTTSSPVGANP